MHVGKLYPWANQVRILCVDPAWVWPKWAALAYTWHVTAWAKPPGLNIQTGFIGGGSVSYSPGGLTCSWDTNVTNDGGHTIVLRFIMGLDFSKSHNEVRGECYVDGTLASHHGNVFSQGGDGTTFGFWTIEPGQAIAPVTPEVIATAWP